MISSVIAESYDSSIFSFLGTFIVFSIVAYQDTFPPTVQKVSLFSTPSLGFIVFWFFNHGHSDSCEVMPHCSFDLHFSNN